MELTRGARRILRNLLLDADRITSEVIRERGGSATNVRESGHWATQKLGDVAEAAAQGNIGAVKAIKIVKNARRLGEKY